MLRGGQSAVGGTLAGSQQDAGGDPDDEAQRRADQQRVMDRGRIDGVRYRQTGQPRPNPRRHLLRFASRRIEHHPLRHLHRMLRPQMTVRPRQQRSAIPMSQPTGDCSKINPRFHGV